MKEIKKPLSLLVLAGVYGLCSLRYFPGNAMKTLLETLLQIVSVAPLPGGATILLVNFLQKSAGQKMPWDRMVRIYLTLGVMLEIIIGFYSYYLKAHKG
jgi:hypothetical protein